MSPRGIGIVLLFLGSELVGFGLGEWFYSLFAKAVPPAVASNFNQGAAHLAFLLYGAASGIVIFVWSLLALSLARFFGPPRLVKAHPAAPGPEPQPPAR
jgi:hypothetical protein